MDSRQEVDVVDWQDSPLPLALQIEPPRRFLPPTLIGILGTVLLHAMFIRSVSFGSHKPKPPETQESAIALLKSTIGADGLVLISLPTVANSNQAARAISSLPDLSNVKIHSPISADPPEFFNLETLAMSEDQASNPTASGSDVGEQARLFGIYTGQIQARIDRVWRRPRTPINENATGKVPTDSDESFQCEAQIVQDARGNVQEILLPRCNGSAAWQRSLVLAIQQASPLPAPPSTKVFTESIILKFVGLPYVKGASNDEFEIPPVARMEQ
jgi:TonB C terminal